MTAKTIMIQGTGSSVGKSLMVTALCRIFRQDGYNVAPFKAQNMSLNSYVTADGAEIGRSQVAQAEAAGVEPTADMNPILLKPEVDYRSQLIVHGKPVGRLESKNFNRRKESLWDAVTESLDRLRAEYEVVVIEGAGSPAEINLRKGDIVNMEVALYANAPVALVGDIDKGGIFASLYGTMMLLAPNERELVFGTIINKFRGDVGILRPGLVQLDELTGVPVLGIVPYFRDIYIPEEDSPSSKNTRDDETALIDIAVITLPHISNFDEFDPLAREPGVNLRYVRTAAELGEPDLVILPGTKTTIPDLMAIKEAGIVGQVKELAAEGTSVIGICGGYQMLGETIFDPAKVESTEEQVDGLGLLPVFTVFDHNKETHQVSGTITTDRGLLEDARGLPFTGYEIHMGATATEADLSEGVSTLERRTQPDVEIVDGVASIDGWVVGTYVHGLFLNDDLRRQILANLARRKGLSMRQEGGQPAFSQDGEYDKLAELVRSSLDMEKIYEVMGFGR